MRKILLYTSLIVFFIILSVFTVFASQTKLYIDPPNIVDKKLHKGDTFTVNVNVADINNLYGYQFKLRYDTSILDATSVVASSFLPSNYCMKRVIDDTEGYISVACILPLGSKTGVSGSGSLETITFQVIGKGESSLDLYKTILGDHNGKAIAHVVEGGYFKNIGRPEHAMK